MLKKNSRITLIFVIIVFVFFAFYLTSVELVSDRDYVITFLILKIFVFFFGMSFGYWIGNNNMQNLEKIFHSNLKLSVLLHFGHAVANIFLSFTSLSSSPKWIHFNRNGSILIVMYHILYTETFLMYILLISAGDHNLLEEC